MLFNPFGGSNVLPTPTPAPFGPLLNEVELATEPELLPLRWVLVRPECVGPVVAMLLVVVVDIDVMEVAGVVVDVNDDAKEGEMGLLGPGVDAGDVGEGRELLWV